MSLDGTLRGMREALARGDWGVVGERANEVVATISALPRRDQGALQPLADEALDALLRAADFDDPAALRILGMEAGALGMEAGALGEVAGVGGGGPARGVGRPARGPLNARYWRRLTRSRDPAIAASANLMEADRLLGADGGRRDDAGAVPFLEAAVAGGDRTARYRLAVVLLGPWGKGGDATRRRALALLREVLAALGEGVPDAVDTAAAIRAIETLHAIAKGRPDGSLTLDEAGEVEGWMRVAAAGGDEATIEFLATIERTRDIVERWGGDSDEAYAVATGERRAVWDAGRDGWEPGMPDVRFVPTLDRAEAVMRALMFGRGMAKQDAMRATALAYGLGTWARMTSAIAAKPGGDVPDEDVGADEARARRAFQEHALAGALGVAAVPAERLARSLAPSSRDVVPTAGPSRPDPRRAGSERTRGSIGRDVEEGFAELAAAAGLDAAALEGGLDAMRTAGTFRAAHWRRSLVEGFGWTLVDPRGGDDVAHGGRFATAIDGSGVRWPLFGTNLNHVPDDAGDRELKALQAALGRDRERAVLLFNAPLAHAARPRTGGGDANRTGRAALYAGRVLVDGRWRGLAHHPGGFDAAVAAAEGFQPRPDGRWLERHAFEDGVDRVVRNVREASAYRGSDAVLRVGTHPSGWSVVMWLPPSLARGLDGAGGRR